LKRVIPTSGSGLMWTSLQTASLGVLERRQHTRMIRAGILSNHEDRLRLLKIFERDCSLSDANRLH
jgi:hypothetical protein